MFTWCNNESQKSCAKRPIYDELSSDLSRISLRHQKTVELYSKVISAGKSHELELCLIGICCNNCVNAKVEMN